MATTAEQALTWVNKMYDVLRKRRPEIEKAFDYFEGRQPLSFASTEWKKFHGNRYAGFADNWCGVVGRSPVDRLRLDGIRIGDDANAFSADEKALMDDWKRNEMGAQSKQGFLASTVAKRSAVLIWGDENDEPLASWEHPAQVAVAYDSMHRRRIAGIKAFIEDGVEYAYLYLPDTVWKFQRPAYVSKNQTESGLYVAGAATKSGWEPYEVPGETWPLNNPLGEVPIVEWLNRPMLGQEPLSDIAGTMAMQDSINLMWAYLFNAADHASLPARVVTGAEPPMVPILKDGQKVGEKPVDMETLAEKRLLYITGEHAKISQWDAAKLDVFTEVIKQAVAHVAAQTSTPGHYLLSNDKFANLNGDALVAAETPLVKKVVSAQEFYNAPARDTFRLMAKVRGNDALADQIRLASIQWKDAAMHSLSQIADAATKDRAVGISLQTVLEKRYGFTQPEIAQELTRIREEDADSFLSRVMRPTPPETDNADVSA